MDIASLIILIITIVLILLFIKLVAAPLIKTVIGLIIFLLLLYLAQNYLGININQIFNRWGLNFDVNWISGPLNYIIDKIRLLTK